MSARTLVRDASLDITRPELRRSGWVTLASLALLGVGALAGGVALVARPDGSVMGFGVEILAGSPFGDFLVPGLILGGLFGIGSLAVVVMGLRRARLAPFLAFGIGCAQMIWIVVELASIGEFSFLHPTFFGVGLLIAIASVPGLADLQRVAPRPLRRPGGNDATRPPAPAGAASPSWRRSARVPLTTDRWKEDLRCA